MKNKLEVFLAGVVSAEVVVIIIFAVRLLRIVLNDMYGVIQ